MEKSDLVFYIIDVSSNDWRRELTEFSESADPVRSKFVFNKSDLVAESGRHPEVFEALKALGREGASFWTSAKSRGADSWFKAAPFHPVPHRPTTVLLVTLSYAR